MVRIKNRLLNGPTPCAPDKTLRFVFLHTPQNYDSSVNETLCSTVDGVHCPCPNLTRFYIQVILPIHREKLLAFSH